MLILKEVKGSIIGNEVYIFSTVIIDRSLIEPCRTFYKQQDRHGRDRIFVLLPLEGKIEKRDSTTILRKSNSHKTIVVWSSSHQLQFNSNTDAPISMTLPDIECPIPYYYHLISARKNAEVKIRDEDGEEMTLVF